MNPHSPENLRRVRSAADGAYAWLIMDDLGIIRLMRENGVQDPWSREEAEIAVARAREFGIEPTLDPGVRAGIDAAGWKPIVFADGRVRSVKADIAAEGPWRATSDKVDAELDKGKGTQ